MLETSFRGFQAQSFNLLFNSLDLGLDLVNQVLPWLADPKRYDPRLIEDIAFLKQVARFTERRLLICLSIQLNRWRRLINSDTEGL